MLEELQSRKKEKVAMFLTFENIIGLILLGFPVFVGSAALPLLLRAPLVVGAALLGVFLTLEAQGLPIYERVVWRVRGNIRIRTSGDTISPDNLAGAAQTPTQERALAVDGPIRTAQRQQGLRPPTASTSHPEVSNQNGVPHGDLSAE